MLSLSLFNHTDDVTAARDRPVGLSDITGETFTDAEIPPTDLGAVPANWKHRKFSIAPQYLAN
jgi:hypothetical protein